MGYPHDYGNPQAVNPHIGVEKMFGIPWMNLCVKRTWYPQIQSSHKDLETALDRELDGPKVHSFCHFVISSFFDFSQFPAGTVHDQMYSVAAEPKPSSFWMLVG